MDILWSAYTLLRTDGGGPAYRVVPLLFVVPNIGTFRLAVVPSGPCEAVCGKVWARDAGHRARRQEIILP